MPRKLEKVEKEMGYCDVKLEKEKRFRRQVAFINAEITATDEQIKILRPHDAQLLDQSGVLPERPTREAFLAAGLLDLLAENRELLQRDRDEMLGRLEHYNGFEDKKHLLEDEKKEVLGNMSASHLARIRRINDDFKKTERVWNELTEDLINADESIFFVERNLDYLRSARNFLIAAKGSYDVEDWRAECYLTDLFRHSNIGRAREMADGADRNMQSAQKEVVCMSNLRLKSESYIRVLIHFMEALYEDLYVSSRIHSTVQVMEAALAGNLKLLGQLKAKKEWLVNKIGSTEKVRAQLFQKMGSGRRSELAI